MTRFARLACMAILLLVPTFAASHMAEYGFLEHDHDGQACDVSLYFRSTAFADVPAPIADPTPVPVTVVRPSMAQTGATFDPARKFLARAPPSSLLPH